MSGMLERIQVAAPCSASWDAMTGDERKRFCAECKLHVYNLSGMRRDEAERFIREAEGSVCVRLYRRPDGTVITQDCPVGLAARARRAMRRVWRRMTAAAVLMVSLLAGGFGCDRTGGTGSSSPAPRPETTGASPSAGGEEVVTGNGDDAESAPPATDATDEPDATDTATAEDAPPPLQPAEDADIDRLVMGRMCAPPDDTPGLEDERERIPADDADEPQQVPAGG